VHASEQVLFPLHFVDKLCEVDFEATATSGGNVGQAGAIRLALSRALLAIVDAETAERMRLGELLVCSVAKFLRDTQRTDFAVQVLWQLGCPNCR